MVSGNSSRTLRLASFAVLLGLASLLVASCAPGASGPSPSLRASRSSGGGRLATSGPFSHVFIVIMENEPYRAALSDPSVTAIAHRYAYDTRSYAASHPSLPNYLALTSGRTFGIRSDCLGCYVSSPNLGEQLSKANVTWEAYFQAVSSPCYLGTSYGLYAAKHNPFRYYRDIRSSKRLCAHLRPYSELRAVLTRQASSVPDFVWVTPDVCNDGHSCSLSTAGRWLTGFVREVTSSAAFKANGLLIATWDEGSGGDTSSISPAGRVSGSGGGGHILTIVATSRLKHGTVLHRPLSAYGVLATIEQNFKLPLLGKAKAWAGHGLFGGG